ncbi:MAG: BlaI/MecI/CopY family transcriptional regulator [Ignavibacteriales bacterium]|jgi:predicted transcriptional regulator|nr:MAG: BlaI/MecI/CopY family transcriptional regulator [Ignavibacteriales bacterium]
MSENRNIKPTVAELEILQILWEKGEVTVKEVNEEINKRKETGYTTTLKTMQIMFEKGLVERKKDGRSHSYSAAIKKEKTQQVLLDKILETAFGGSASKLVMQALGNKKTTKQELQEIKELINKLERDSK